MFPCAKFRVAIATRFGAIQEKQKGGQLYAPPPLPGGLRSTIAVKGAPSNDEGPPSCLTLAPIRHFPKRGPIRGGSMRPPPPRVWPLIELAPRDKNERVGRDEISLLV